MSFTRFDVDQLSPRMIYSLLIEAVVPRPIAYITTLGLDGSTNAAPYSFFNAVSSNPPIISVSITPKRGGVPKDTLKNIRETKEFVVNIVPDFLAEAVNQSSADYPYGVSELGQVGLTAISSEKVKPPRVKECPVQLECRLYKEVNIGEGLGSSSLVLGEVVAFQVDESVLTQVGDHSGISFEKLKPLSRIGGMDYVKDGKVFSLPRPQIETKDKS